MKRRYKITIAYDGSGYSGWQYQENATGIQQLVEEAVAYLEGGFVRVFGSSRTDAGVHANGFVAHFDLTRPVPPANVVKALNSRLPPAIRVMKAAYAKPGFDARLSATGKEYRYHIYQSDIMPPAMAPYWTFCHRPLDTDAMRKAAEYFVGRHDFVSFAANPNRELETTVRNIFSTEVKRTGRKIVFIVRGDGFLYKQIRSMAGFLIAVGKGNEKPEAVKELLDAATPRTARVETAPPNGLSLWKVFYGDIKKCSTTSRNS